MNWYRIEFVTQDKMMFDEVRKEAIANFFRDRLGIKSLFLKEETTTSLVSTDVVGV